MATTNNHVTRANEVTNDIPDSQTNQESLMSSIDALIKGKQREIFFMN